MDKHLGKGCACGLNRPGRAKLDPAATKLLIKSPLKTARRSKGGSIAQAYLAFACLGFVLLFSLVSVFLLPNFARAKDTQVSFKDSADLAGLSEAHEASTIYEPEEIQTSGDVQVIRDFDYVLYGESIWYCVKSGGTGSVRFIQCGHDLNKQDFDVVVTISDVSSIEVPQVHKDQPNLGMIGLSPIHHSDKTFGWWISTRYAEARVCTEYFLTGTNIPANVKAYGTISDIDACVTPLFGKLGQAFFDGNEGFWIPEQRVSIFTPHNATYETDPERGGVVASKPYPSPTSHSAEVYNPRAMAYVLTEEPRLDIHYTGGTCGLQFDFHLELPRGQLKLQKKSSLPDLSSNNSAYDLAGATYEVSSLSSNKPLRTITLLSDGNAKQQLLAGKYQIKELKAPPGYKLDQSIREFEILNTQDTVLNLEDEPCFVKAPIVVQKLDEQSGTNQSLGAATLAKAQFKLSFYPGYYESAASLPEKAARSWTIQSDESGKAILDKEHLVKGDPFYINKNEIVLPLGTLLIEETEAPRGYVKLNEPKIVQLKTANEKAEDIHIEAVNIPNKVIRGDVYFNKVSSPSMERLAHIPFLVTSKTTGERHVVVADENGMVNTSLSNFNKEDLQKLNSNDALLSEDGSSITDSEKLDSTAPIFFSGSSNSTKNFNDFFERLIKGNEAAQQNSLPGALVFDSYEIQELSCPENKNLQLVRFSITISKDGQLLDMGTIDDQNQPTELSTSASLTLNENGSAKLSDKLSFKNLPKANKLKLETSLMNPKTKTAVRLSDGKVFSKESELKLEQGAVEGQVDLEISKEDLEKIKTEGERFVVFQKVFDKNGKVLASHEDFNSESQTVEISKTNNTPPLESHPDEGDPTKEPKQMPKTGLIGEEANIVFALAACVLLVGGIYCAKKAFGKGSSPVSSNIY